MYKRAKSRIDSQSIAVATAIGLLLIIVGCGAKKSASDGPNLSSTAAAVPTPISSPIDENVISPTTPVAVEFQTASSEVSYEVAEAAYNERRYRDAVQLFTQYTERKPENPWGYYMLGLSARNNGETETAISAFEQALNLDSLHAKSWVNLARANMDAGQPEEALDNLDRAIELSSESGTTMRLQGRAFHQLGEIDDAIAAYQQAIVFNTEDAWAINNLALVYIEQGRYEEAIPMLARAVEIKHGIPVFHNNLGMALENTNRFRQAEEAYRQALSADATYAKAEVNLTRVENVEGDVDETSLDLEMLADSFEASIKEWFTDVIEVDAPDSLVAVSELVESVLIESEMVELDNTEPSSEPDQSDVETGSIEF